MDVTTLVYFSTQTFTFNITTTLTFGTQKEHFLQHTPNAKMSQFVKTNGLKTGPETNRILQNEHPSSKQVLHPENKTTN